MREEKRNELHFELILTTNSQTVVNSIKRE